MTDSKTGPHEQDLSVAVWRKSSASGAEHECVEMAELPDGGVAVRDSKDTARESLRFAGGQWAAFRDGLVAGEL